MPFLERAAVLPGTQTDYLARVQEFIRWCHRHRLDWDCAEQLDDVIVNFLDREFFRGLSPSDGGKLLGALQRYIPRIRSNGDWALPRARRALKTWQLLAPAFQRLPLPWVCLCAMLGWCLFRRQVAAAIHLLVAFRAYLRPGVSDRLRVFQLVRGCPLAGSHYECWGLLLNASVLHTPGKTGTFDGAVALDTEMWLHDFFLTLKQGRQPLDPLWPVRGGPLIDLFEQAAHDLALEALAPCRYSMQH